MNIKQMQSAIKRFRAADVSLIEDEKLRAKAQRLQAKQGGFTLLELLVVITLLATLSTAALVAYEGVGENAADAASANNILAAESSIRNYRAVENVYPNQWDNLANLDGTTPGTTGTETLLADATQAFLGQWVTTPATPLAGGTVLEAVGQALAAVGIDELQTLDPTTAYTNPVPNLSWNESAPGLTAGGASELEFIIDGTSGLLTDIQWNETTQLGSPVALSIVPSGGEDGLGAASTCSADGATISTAYDGITTVTDNATLNLINDALSDDNCSLVIAVGFGKDVPGTTIDSRVAIGQAPTAGTDNVNPATNYARYRYIALFQVAEDADNSTTIDAGEVFQRARLIGVVDPEGRTLDAAIAGANQGA